MNHWDGIDRADFEGDMIDVVDAIGITATKRLLEVFGGEPVYFPKTKSVIRAARDRKIYKEFNGFNFRELAITYNLTTRQIRIIVQEQRKKNPKSKARELDLF